MAMGGNMLKTRGFFDQSVTQDSLSPLPSGLITESFIDSLKTQRNQRERLWWVEEITVMYGKRGKHAEDSLGFLWPICNTRFPILLFLQESFIDLLETQRNQRERVWWVGEITVMYGKGGKHAEDSLGFLWPIHNTRFPISYSFRTYAILQSQS